MRGVYPKITPLLPFGLRTGRSTLRPKLVRARGQAHSPSRRAASGDTPPPRATETASRGGRVKSQRPCETDARPGTVGARPKVGFERQDRPGACAHTPRPPARPSMLASLRAGHQCWACSSASCLASASSSSLVRRSRRRRLSVVVVGGTCWVRSWVRGCVLQTRSCVCVCVCVCSRVWTQSVLVVATSGLHY